MQRLRCSRWNLLTDAPRSPQHTGRLTLEPSPSSRNRRSPVDSLESSAAAEWPKSVFRYYAWPWLTTTRRRYSAGNRWLNRILDAITGKLWPLAAMDDFSSWMQDGSAAARVFMGLLAGSVAAILLFQNIVPLFPVLRLVNSPALFGHGPLLLILASALAGLTILPFILGHAIPVLTRLLVFAALCALAAGLCYGSYQLFVSAQLL